MIIPSCLTLTPGQQAKLEEFASSLKPISIEEHDENFGGACFTSRLEFRIQDTSIGFNLSVRDEITGRSISLLTDEDIDNL